ncbi:MAG: CotH kinase family protein [Bacillus sp. (in: Bacteria)]|nr:CotH kinase family protein [Bacillus sp. (in: firmicutes)]MCM1425395.1 CotH kinase family protein [Eubacterium sp.]
MSTSRYIDRICAGALIGVLLITILFVNAGKMGVLAVSASAGYESRLFNTATVHTIDIVMDDWDSFLESCTNEEYTNCTVLIDGDAYRNVAIRAKGNTSLSQVEAYGNDRYSFKIEFDHYDKANTYYGLDKLCLNNIIQDNTYMKDYLTYQLMRDCGVDAPLCSYAYITVNGEDWGLYLAVEGVEEAFLKRNYGNDYGALYKPDSMSMGGGRGNGREFDMGQFDFEQPMQDERNGFEPPTQERQSGFELPAQDGAELPERGEWDGLEPRQQGGFMPGKPDGENGMREGMGGAMPGSSDVSLIYTDDEYDSYSNIFENAKTTISDSDKNRLIASLKQLNGNENIEDIVDVEEVIRYFVVHNFVLNFDSYTGDMIHNYYLYEKDGQLSMIPWDYNLAFGGFVSQTDAESLINYPIDTPVSGNALDSRPMLAWIFEEEEYTQLYHQYFSEFITEYFDSGYFSEMIDSLEEMIAPYVESDPTKFCTYDEFKEGVSTLKEFCLLRAESISGQLDGTIPATADGQSQDASALIDAENLSVSAMGSMGDMMGPHGSRKN